MKRIIILYTTFLCSFLAACNAQDGGSSASDNSADAKDEKKISKRDRSITAANAYNDLFLDSSAVESFIVQHKIPDTLSRRIRSFYNTRNYQFAWFSSRGLTEQAKGFWNLHDYHTTYRHDTVLHDKTLARTMDNLIAEESPHFSASNKSTVNTEIMLTEHFIQYMLTAYEDGYVKRKEMERFIPRKKEDPMAFADSILTKKHKDNKYFEDVNEPYKKLKEQLSRYYAIAKKGGWPAITGSVKSYKKGSSSPAIALLKKRLQITGDMPAGDTSQVFTDTLAAGIRTFQQRLGYTPTGTLTDVQLKDLNVPVQQRLQQLLLNMERMRWMPTEPEGNLIVVNIPEFVLHVYEGKTRAFDMNVVVGKEGHNTTMFNGDLNQIVFSPYWNVPPSIVKNEILPKMAANPGYLAAQNMEQIGTEGGLPKIRQLPGEGNSLGKVKFLFPNSFNIYFHDTNAKSLFSKDKRAYSHGCIRLSDPTKMAEYLLRGQPEWTPARIDEAMNSGTEKYVKLKKPVPVMITYYTAWVDDNGLLNFRDDIYTHDRDLAVKMFAGNQQMARR
ncbi:MAG: L,D-transpeptidase family protein [Flaviaesturariibacter sp.]|nr:L,D-transpeptidase family protein [Flaviaesturariibacter sp.]